MNNSSDRSEAIEDFLATKAELDKAFQSLHHYSNERFLSKNVLIYRLIKSEIELIEVLYKISEFKSIRSQFTIQRAIVDYYSIIYLLTSYNSKEEQNLRYYLYVLDMLNSRINTHSEIKKETPGEILNAQNQKTYELVEEDKKTRQDVLDIIRTKKLNLAVNENIINKCNWKFKNPENNDKFSWTQLAENSKIPGRFAIFYQDYASHFVHGIGSSPIIVDDEKIVDTVINETLKFSSILMCLTIKIIVNEFVEETKFVNINSKIRNKSDCLWNN
jgi:hypothetical protein